MKSASRPRNDLSASRPLLNAAYEPLAVVVDFDELLMAAITQSLEMARQQASLYGTARVAQRGIGAASRAGVPLLSRVELLALL
jgi:hypothetical protein